MRPARGHPICNTWIHRSPQRLILQAAQEHQVQEHQVPRFCVCVFVFPFVAVLPPFVPTLARSLCDSFSYFAHSARAEALSFMRSELQLLCIEAHRRRKEVRNAKYPRKPPPFVRGKGKLTRVDWCAQKAADGTRCDIVLTCMQCFSTKTSRAPERHRSFPLTR